MFHRLSLGDHRMFANNTFSEPAPHWAVPSTGPRGVGQGAPELCPLLIIPPWFDAGASSPRTTHHACAREGARRLDERGPAGAPSGDARGQPPTGRVSGGGLGEPLGRGQNPRKGGCWDTLEGRIFVLSGSGGAVFQDEDPFCRGGGPPRPGAPLRAWRSPPRPP